MDGNGWEEHKRAVLFRLDAIEDAMDSDHNNCNFRMKVVHEQHDQLLGQLQTISLRLATLEGRLLGFMTAASVLGGAVSLAIQILLKVNWR